MTAEAILKAEQELKVTAAAPKINRAGPVVPETLPAATVPVATNPDPKPAGLLRFPDNIFITKLLPGTFYQGKRTTPPTRLQLRYG